MGEKLAYAHAPRVVRLEDRRAEAYNYRIGNRQRVSQIPIHRVDGHGILVIQDQYCDLIQEPN